ncbi:MAG: AAA family ATPase [Candidatus Heimdallarchaeota archaeon]
MVSEILIRSQETKRDFVLSGKITHIYGPPKSGKSTLSANLAFELVKHGFKVLIISTERPIEIRMNSMIEASEEYSLTLLNNILTSDIYSFEELIQLIIKDLPQNIDDVDIVIIDSLTASYRFKPGPISLTLLRKALAVLQSIALIQKKAIVFTNQVAAVMNETNDFRPVASASTRNYSDITIRLNKISDDSTEISFEDVNGLELEVFEPTLISASGIDDFNRFFLIED